MHTRAASPRPGADNPLHGRGRLGYAVTVRFAGSSSPPQLAMAGRLCREHPDAWMQTHVAENRDEVRWIAELFPEARSYLDVYDRAGCF